MTEKEYKEHIQYTHNAYCRIVIRHASIDAARMLYAKWKREISLEYLSEEKFMVQTVFVQTPSKWYAGSRCLKAADISDFSKRLDIPVQLYIIINVNYI